MKLISYSIDSLKTIIQSIEMNTSHISSNTVQQSILNIQELKWPITNMTQLDENEKLLTDINIKNNEVSDSYYDVLFVYNKKKIIVS